MKLGIQHGLPIVSLTIAQNGQSIVLRIDFMMRAKCKVNFETMNIELEN
ncbi:hypothetical protein MHI37_21610 [Paenibacillus sp. FSL H8-0548]|nr:hypothetical protein [Paenibacillus sp. FSL H8-0548]